MDCREFRHKHVGFIDDTLPACDMAAMRQHRDCCVSCSRHDTSVRRSLLLFRNLPNIEPSAEFMERLNLRLRAADSGALVAQAPRAFSAASFAVLAAGIGLIALYGFAMTHGAHDIPLRLAPVVASTPELPQLPPAVVVTPAFAASVPTGMGVWPAVLMAGQAQLHMANLELRDSR